LWFLSSCIEWAVATKWRIGYDFFIWFMGRIDNVKSIFMKQNKFTRLLIYSSYSLYISMQCNVFDFNWLTLKKINKNEERKINPIVLSRQVFIFRLYIACGGQWKWMKWFITEERRKNIKTTTNLWHDSKKPRISRGSNVISY
jgi:hypothetical protein